MLKSTFGRFRLIGWVEGISFVLLVLVAMPLKYIADIPGPVSVIGMIHGALFFLYLIALIQIAIEESWKLTLGIVGFLAAVFPFGPMIFDYWLVKNRSKTQAISK